MPVVISGYVSPSSGIGSPAEPDKNNLHTEILKKMHGEAIKNNSASDEAIAPGDDSLHDDVVTVLDAKATKKPVDDSIIG